MVVPVFSPCRNVPGESLHEWSDIVNICYGEAIAFWGELCHNIRKTSEMEEGSL